MVASPYSVRKDKAMISSTWLCVPLLYLLSHQTLAAVENRHRIYGDISDDDVVIDHLEDYLQRRSLHDRHPKAEESTQYLNKELEVPAKIPFAVPPGDPRYFLPSPVLRGEASSADSDSYSDYRNSYLNYDDPDYRNLYSDYKKYNDYNSLPADDMMRGPHEQGTSDGQHQPQYDNLDFHQPEHTSDNYLHSPHYVDSFDPPRYHHALHGEKTNYQESHETHAADKTQDLPTSPREIVNYLQESRHQAQVPRFLMKKPGDGSAVLSDFYFIALAAGCTAAAVCAVIGAGICYYRLHKNKRDAAETEYPAYGVTGPNKDMSPGAADRKLAQSAHMFHYQHQKQQMIALEKSSGDERRCSASDADSEEEGEEGDYTVYECPGLAPTGEMEVKNPLFSDDPTPATPAQPQTSSNDARTDDGDEEELQ